MKKARKWIKDNWYFILKTFYIAWPAVLESFFVALAGVIDSLMVSSVGTYAVAAVGLTTQPKFIGLAPFLAVNVAVSALVARRKGEGRRDEANKVLILSLLFVIFAGTIISIACIAFADPVIRLCGSEPETHDAAVRYFQIIMGGMMFNILSLGINAAQRGAGNTKIAMRTNLTSSLVNICFNYLLIGGHFGFPAMGVTGAAIATVLGTVVACAMSFLSIMGKDSFISLPYILINRIRPSFSHALVMVKIASATFLEQIMLRIGFLSVAVMAAKLGTDAFAAHQVGMNVMSLSFSFGDGMQVAAVTLIGQSLGEKKVDQAKLYGKICQRMGNLISICLSVIYLLGGKAFFRLYFEEEHIVNMGVQIMALIVIIVLMQIAQVIYMGCLRGAGDVVFTTIASTVSVTLLRPIASYLFAYILNWGLIGIWMGVLTDQLSRLLFTTWRFKSGKWTKIQI